MAFIRWKRNQFGMAYAHLVHSYRDANGKPRHKTLAYLGKKGELTDDHLAKLKERHKDLPVKWHAIVRQVSPVQTDISLLSDAELLSQFRSLRIERGLTAQQMVEALITAGVYPRTNGAGRTPRHMTRWDYRNIEKACLNGEKQKFYINPESEFAPFVRKVLS